MFKQYEMELGGRKLVLEFGKYAEQANGSTFVRYGDTVLLVTATASDKPRDGIDFFPLSVDFEEKLYSVGKIPGGFIKREGRPSEKAIRQPRSVPDLGYPTRKADTKAVKTHSGGHRAAEARQTAEGGCRTRTHTRPPSAAVTPVVPHRHGYASSSLSRFRMPGSTSCRTKSAKTPGIKLSC